MPRARQISPSARKDIGSPEPESTSPRHDAPPRPAPTALSWSKIVNGDPKKFYVMVGRDPLSISTYEDLGYKRTVAKDGGVRLGGGSVVDGSTIANKDTIMMEISREEHDRLVAEGVGGAGGQRWAKHLEEQLESRPLPDGLQRRVGDRSRMHFRFDNLDG